MPSFSVVITETVIVRYKAIAVTAPDKAGAINAADLVRCDGELDDPEVERVQDVTFEVSLHQPATAAPDATGPELYVTGAGLEAINATGQPSEA